jgi:hypothetical protein
MKNYHFHVVHPPVAQLTCATGRIVNHFTVASAADTGYLAYWAGC